MNQISAQSTVTPPFSIGAERRAGRSAVWRHGGRRVNWARVAGVTYDKFDGEFASCSLTYASTGTVRYRW